MNKWEHIYNHYNMSDSFDEVNFVNLEPMMLEDSLFEPSLPNTEEELANLWKDYNDFKSLLTAGGHFDENDFIDLDNLSCNEALALEAENEEPIPLLSEVFKIDKSVWESNFDQGLFKVIYETKPIVLPSAMNKLLFEDNDEYNSVQENIYIKRHAGGTVCKIGRTILPSKLKKGTQIFPCKSSKLMKTKIVAVFKSKYKYAKQYGIDYFEGDYASMVDTINDIIKSDM